MGKKPFITGNLKTFDIQQLLVWEECQYSRRNLRKHNVSEKEELCTWCFSKPLLIVNTETRRHEFELIRFRLDSIFI